jgi:hypothetical protein
LRVPDKIGAKQSLFTGWYKSLSISLFQREKLNKPEDSLKGSKSNSFSFRYMRAGFRKGREPLPKDNLPLSFPGEGVRG